MNVQRLIGTPNVVASAVRSAAPFLAMLLVGCGPSVGSDEEDSGSGSGSGSGSATGGVEPGTCEVPAEGAFVGIVRRRAFDGSARISLAEAEHGLDCDTHLSCAEYRVDVLSIDGGIAVGSVDPSQFEDSEDYCTCEDFGTGGQSVNCDETEMLGTVLQIATIGDGCVTGSFQRVEGVPVWK